MPTLTIKQRIFVACSIPLVALIGVSSFMLYKAWGDAQSAGDMRDVLAKA